MPVEMGQTYDFYVEFRKKYEDAEQEPLLKRLSAEVNSIERAFHVDQTSGTPHNLLCLFLQS